MDILLTPSSGIRIMSAEGARASRRGVERPERRRAFVCPALRTEAPIRALAGRANGNATRNVMITQNEWIFRRAGRAPSQCGG